MKVYWVSTEVFGYPQECFGTTEEEAMDEWMRTMNGWLKNDYASVHCSSPKHRNCMGYHKRVTRKNRYDILEYYGNTVQEVTVPGTCSF